MRARIIKPGFWDDEKIARASRDARLLFIGLWNASDDYGVVKGQPVWLRSQIFPYDDIPLDIMAKWLQELEGIGVIAKFTHNDESFYYIKNFSKHQIINRPSKTRNPEPPQGILTKQSHNTHEPVIENKDKPTKKTKTLTEYSVSTHGVVSEPTLQIHEGLTDEIEIEREVEIEIEREVEKGREGVWGGEGEGKTSSNGKTPFDTLVSLYNETCSSLPRIQKLTDRRKKEIRTRWRTYPDMDIFRRLFKKAQESDFLSGRSGRWTGCNFDWLLKEANMIKVLEGCYDNKDNARGMAAPTSDEGWEEEKRIISEKFGGDINEYGFWISAGKPPIDEWRRRRN